MHATIDDSRCQARGYCAKFAPRVFALDDDGYGMVIEKGEIPDELIASARAAETACPEQAVRLHD